MRWYEKLAGTPSPRKRWTPLFDMSVIPEDEDDEIEEREGHRGQDPWRGPSSKKDRSDYRWRDPGKNKTKEEDEMLALGGGGLPANKQKA
jgi:hypothetical protein